MRTLKLREHEKSTGVELTSGELALLAAAVPSVRYRKERGRDAWTLHPTSTVGSVSTWAVDRRGADAEHLKIEIRPKLSIARLLFLIGYSVNPVNWQDELTEFSDQDDLVEAMAEAFVRLLQPVVRSGLLQGYRTRDEALNGVRGRIRFEDQVRRRGRQLLPLEVRYDDFTVDILENRLLAEAVRLLRRLTLRRASLRRVLRVLDDTFYDITRPRWRPDQVPAISWTRLNRHYRPASELARRILRSCSFDLDGSGVRAHGFLIDMNALFEDFLVVALREALRLDAASFPQECAGRRFTLDVARQLQLKPDLSWWERGRCVFVGDAKYKRDSGRGHRSDLYQLLAYLRAAKQSDGVLVYGELTGPSQTHQVLDGDTRLHVIGLDLSQPPAGLLAQIGALADWIRGLRSSSPDAGEEVPAPWTTAGSGPRAARVE